MSHIDAQYATDGDEDLLLLKMEEVTNWLKAWTFVEGCGLTGSDEDEDADNGEVEDSDESAEESFE